MTDDVISVGARMPRISKAVAGDGRMLHVVWESGIEQDIDVSPALASHRAFVKLRSDDQLFRSLRVSEYGDAIEWPDGTELAAVWIEELGEGSLANAEFRDAMDRMKLSLDGMAAHLGIARRLVADYRKDKPIPKYVALATRYLLSTRKAG
jgi:hypothetical protein